MLGYDIKFQTIYRKKQIAGHQSGTNQSYSGFIEVVRHMNDYLEFPGHPARLSDSETWLITRRLVFYYKVIFISIIW